MTSTNNQIAEFRAHVASRLGVDTNAPNATLLAALDDKITNRSAARDDALGSEERALFEQAWPQHPKAAGHVMSSDDQLYAQAWGSTENDGDV